MGVQDRSTEGTDTGRVLAGRYVLGDRLGRGGMGTVWRARDEMLDREVAVKELTVNHLPEEELEILQSRMKREARAAARIKHPGVITIHDVLEDDGRPWIVMELVDGRSLADVISQDGTLAPREAAEVGLQVLAALHRGHQLGVLHRDVKPANVLLEKGTGRVVLLDFGIATFEGSTELTRPGDLVGSPDYLAPERAQGERPGPASDLWGLGATLYAAVEGESPFRRTSPLTTLAAVVGDPLPEPRRAGALGPVLAALMAKDPAERPAADEAARMLREVTAGHTMGMKARPAATAHRVPTQQVPVVDRTEPPARPAGHSTTAPTLPVPEAAPTAQAPVAAPPTEPVPPVAPAGPAGRRRRLLPLLLVGLVVVLAAAAGVYVLKSRSGRDEPRDDAASGAPQITVPTTRASDTPGPAPSGYVWKQDPAGFRFPMPVATSGKSWVRSTDNNEIYYSPDNKVHYLQFAVTVGQPLTPLQHFEQMEQSITKNRPAYRRESLTGIKVNGQEGAVWEFSYTSLDGSGRRHLKEVEFRTEDGTSYDVLVASPDKDWQEALRRFTVVLNNFSVEG
ncbi:serine/threonine protein kinase [Streptomyces sp. TLI_235]|nr:serine/threonine-protein kinase [Streptomyces sp. TLI_235]PBC79380.1 serine/threonine protein kinase [Streptomyces sp. TLI_235]